MSVEECLIEDIRNYRYLTYGNVPVAGQDDEELYRQLLEAMNIMGFSKEEQIGELQIALNAMCEVLEWNATHRGSLAHMLHISG